MNIKKIINKNRMKLIVSTILWTLIGVIVSKTNGIFNMNPLIHTMITMFMVESINISLNYGTLIENKYLHKRLKHGRLDYIGDEKQKTNEKVVQIENEKKEELNKSVIKSEELITTPNNIIDYETEHKKVLKKKLERKIKSI